MDKNKFGQVLYFLPYLPIQKVWTFWKLSLVINVYFLNFARILVVNNQVKYYQGPLWIKDFHRDDLNYKEIHSTITIYGIMYTFIGMDINIWPTYPENLCPNFFFGKSMAQKYPAYLQFGHWTYVQTFVFFLEPFP